MKRIPVILLLFVITSCEFKFDKKIVIAEHEIPPVAVTPEVDTVSGKAVPYTPRHVSLQFMGQYADDAWVFVNEDLVLKLSLHGDSMGLEDIDLSGYEGMPKITVVLTGSGENMYFYPVEGKPIARIIHEKGVNSWRVVMTDQQ